MTPRASTAPRRHVAIVGGGIAGLSVAHALLGQGAAARGIDVSVLERASRPGGHIRTENVDGFLCEWGPNGFLDNAPATLSLVHDLGLDAQVQPSDDRARTRFIFRGGRLHRLPGGPLGLAGSRLLSWPGKLRLALEPFARARPDGDESVHAFASRRIGVEAADVLVDSMVSGIFGGNARELSLRACFPKMWDLETEHGGLLRAMVARRRAHPRRRGDGIGTPLGRLTSFRGGAEDLVRGLMARVGGVVRTSVDVTEVTACEGRYRLQIAGLPALEADAVVFASGAAATARTVRALDSPLADVLGTIPTASMVVVCLGYGARAIGHPRTGFGYLIPRSEGLRTLGVLWDSSVYPGRAPAGHVLLRAMVGGATDPDAVDLDDASIIAVVRQELHTAMGVDAMPDVVRIVRHRTGIPQYTIGHLDSLAQAESRLVRWPGALLAGNAYRGVSINACIADAQTVAARVLAHCDAIRTADRGASVSV
jgi:oxygen-dependent protoporphyrinogen oxidase